MEKVPMKRIIEISQFFLLTAFIASGMPSAHADDQDPSLEPCINGAVSATGMYESQALENAAMDTKRQIVTGEYEYIGSGADDVISAFGGTRDDFNR
jgi:hypothetical protein